MTPRTRRLSLTLALVLTLSALSGCWDARELDTLSIVTGVGIDLGEQPESITLTVQVEKTIEDSQGGSGGGAGEDKPYLTLQKTGESLMKATRDFTHDMSRQLMFQHNHVVVFGRDAAKQGVRPYVDLLLRDHESRMDIWVIVADTTANEVLSIDSQLEKIPAVGLSPLIKNQRATSESTCINLLEFVSKLQSGSTGALAILAKIDEGGEKPVVYIKGLAVFKDDKLVGELTDQQTRGYLWVVSRIRSGIIPIRTDQGRATLEIGHSTAKHDISVREDGSISIDIRVSMEGTLTELSGFIDMPMDQIMPIVENECARIIEDEIGQSLRTAQALNSDFFGFGQAINRKYPKYWESIEDNWDEVFPQIEFNVRADCKVPGTGKILKFIHPKEKQE